LSRVISPSSTHSSSWSSSSAWSATCMALWCQSSFFSKNVSSPRFTLRSWRLCGRKFFHAKPQRPPRIHMQFNAWSCSGGYKALSDVWKDVGSFPRSWKRESAERSGPRNRAEPGGLGQKGCSRPEKFLDDFPGACCSLVLHGICGFKLSGSHYV
jgi:hypothetical protein